MRSTGRSPRAESGRTLRGPSRRRRALAWLVLGPLLAGLGPACASRSYRPTPAAETGLFERIQSQERDGLRVSAAVPSAEEAQAIFGLPLAERGIEAVWLRIENRTPHRHRFAPTGMDDEYYPPYEVAYMHRRRYADAAYAELEEHLADLAMTRWIWPGQTASGFVFTHLARGTKAVAVDLFAGQAPPEVFAFFLDVPGREADHSAIDFGAIYADDEIEDLELDGFREALDRLDCCAATPGGEAGLPFNAVLVGPGLDVLQALLRAGWSERSRQEALHTDGSEPRFDGRPPDAVFRKRRASGGDRNALRVWRAPMTVEGEPVWLAQVTHSLGRPTALGRALLGRRVDPDLDGARDFLLQLLWYAQALERYAWHRALPSVPASHPRTDARGAAWFTGGRRVVMWLSGAPVSQLETVVLGWAPPPGTTTGGAP